MRKLKLQMQMTIDGFVCGPNGELDWITMPWTDDINNYVAGLLEPVDTIILGRKLAEGFIPYWAGVAADPTNPEQSGGIKFTDTPKVVFSKTLDESQWDNTVLAKGELAEEIAALKNRDGGDIYACGGAGFAASLAKEGLIDEYYLFINPSAIGKGRSIFEKLEDRLALKLEQTVAFDCGITLLKFTK